VVFKKSYQRGCFDRRLANHLEMPRKKKRHKKYRSKVKKKHAEAYQATSQDCKDADVTIWTDGSCVASQFGPGAWSFILRSDEKEIEASGYDPHTTVNRMEMMAAVEGLKRCPEGVAVLVISDSMLLVKCGSGEWKRKANLDLWSLLDEQMKNRSVVFRWVRSHNGDEMNERCDTLCGQARRSKLGGITEKTLVKKEVAVNLAPVVGEPAISVVVQIGNSDNKLSQREWSDFVGEVSFQVTRASKVIHFFGGSATYERWQNVCWVVELVEPHLQTLKAEVARIRGVYRQDSVAIVVGNVEMI
jgi:ribonuclease HI